MSTDNNCESCSKEYYNRVPISRITEKINKYFEYNDLGSVRSLLSYWDEEARNIGDRRGLLEVLNEEIGFFRRVSEAENALNAVKEAFEIIDELGLGSDVSTATVYLNGATTMKSFGKATDAMPYYMKAKEVFERDLDPNDYKMAALYNNMSSAYNDLGDYESCEEFCFKAIGILENNDDCYGEIAVTLVNLAHLYYEQDPLDDRIYDMMDKAWDLLTSSNNTLDGNFAYLCSKCYPSFGFFGYFEREAQLIRLTEHIYERN